LVFVVKNVMEQCKRELNRELILPTRPFPRFTYKEVVQLLSAKGYEIDYGTEIPWNAEEDLSAMYSQPFFIYDYPIAARGFYDREDPDRPGILKDFDLLYPEGFGEALSGGEREHTLEGVLKRMQMGGEDPKEYGWYMEMLARGVPPSSGFGDRNRKIDKMGLRSRSYMGSRTISKSSRHHVPIIFLTSKSITKRMILHLHVNYARTSVLSLLEVCTIRFL